MGTNYYVHIVVPPIGDVHVHIGKSSAGWEFLWRGHPERGLLSSEDWHVVLSSPGVQIESEYGEQVPLGEFWPMATVPPPGVKRQFDDPERGYALTSGWRDKSGCAFIATEFC